MKQGRQVAYLSDGEKRSRQNAGGLLPSWAREMRESERAVGEARAILAETEPQTSMDAPTGLFSIRAFAIAAHGRGPAWKVERAAARAITESLAAFVALEIS